MRFFTSILIILLLLSGCSSKPSLEIVSSAVEVKDDRAGKIGITYGEKQGIIMHPISLSYNFVIKNIGKKSIGGTEKPNNDTFDYDDGIKVHIEPNDTLKSVSEEVMGFNIYDAEERKKANLGMGKTGNPVIEPNQVGEYTFDFDLGASEENPEIRIAPSSDQLDRLKNSAMDATLIVSVEDEEIARFDLKNSN